MLLYHYTSVECLESIWRSKKLRFSPAKNTNDFFERFKTFVLTQDTFMCDGYPLDRDQFDNFDEKIREELNNYKQVSFSYDYNNGLKGYASPMMWGQYAWRKNKVGTWQNGVCLAIDSEKIKEPAFKIYSSKIFYNSVIDTPRVENIDYTKEGAAALFVARNIHAYFFTKHKHWEHENEYRYICKHEVELDISEAIISIYTLWDDYSPLEYIKSIVNNNSLIRLVSLSDFRVQEEEPYSLKEIDDLQEAMKTYNLSHKDICVSSDL